ncbi:MAG: molecular chaperone DnaJ [Clostridia bacterium]|nr:molecular chaperone DnaJ [Clostridia bacterium]
MADKRDYYEVLGIQKGADEATIKKAYRSMAKKYHPDMNPGDKEAEAKFKEANEAYEVLSDPEKKSRYDQFGHAGVDPNMGGGAGGGFGGFGGFGGGFDMGDIFENIFGGGFGGSSARSNAPRQGSDIEIEAEISFEEAAFGVMKELSFKRVEQCGECSGTGAEKGTSAETCSECRGTGQVKRVQRTMLGNMMTTSPCSRCGGKGKIIKTPCKNCNGRGVAQKNKKIKLDIPQGIDHGQYLQKRGFGNAGANGGPYGDLLIGIRIKPHPIFTRKGADVFCEVPISFTEAALGGEIEVPTIHGKQSYKIPEGTQTGTQFVIKNKGIKKVFGTGEHYFTVAVEVPRKLSSKQKELLKAYAESESDENCANKKSFMDKVKELFK